MANTRTPAAAGSGGTRSPITDEQVRSSITLADENRDGRSRSRRRSRRSRDESSAAVVSASAPSSDSIISRLADFVMALLRDLDESVSSLLS